MKLAHVIPNFHNPAGCTLSAPKRERLVELAAEHGFWLFEDDPYRLISFGDDPPPTMLSLDRADRVIHASSFSKTVSPGVRVGYLAGPAEQIKTLAKRGSEHYISPNMLAESVVLELCRSGALAANVEVVNEALAARRDALVAALRERLPEGEFVVPEGGYFLWIDFPEQFDTVGALSAAASEGVAFVAGPDFLLEGGGSSLRLSFASVPVERIAEGVERLARALESVRAAEPPPERRCIRFTTGGVSCDASTDPQLSLRAPSLWTPLGPWRGLRRETMRSLRNRRRGRHRNRNQGDTK